MAYLYNAYQGSLADLEQRLQDVDEEERLERLDELVDQTWTPIATDRLSEVDWHTLDDVVALAERRIPEVAPLLHGLFVDPPLEISPDGPGWSGCLTAGESRILTERLREVLDPGEIDLVSRLHHRDARPVQEQEPRDLALIDVFVTLSGVDDGRDVIVYLG